MEGTAGQEEEAGGSSSSRGIILPLKKRALNDRRPVSSLESSPEPEEVKLEEEEHGSVDGDEESSAPNSAAATPPEKPAADHDPLSAAVVTDLAENLNKFLQKSKWAALPEASPAPPPVAEKLMGDAIRSSAAATARARTMAHHHPVETKPLMCDAIRGSAAAAEQQQETVFGAAVRRRLHELRATRPFLLYKKTLEMSDVNDEQNRLLVSCKKGRGRDECAITHCVSPAEMARVENKAVGLLVPSMDQDAVSDTLTLKFLHCNGGYRFISKGWKDFRERNGLVLNENKRWTRDVELEVWAFRSRKLRKQPPLDENGKLHKREDPITGKEIKDAGLELELDYHFHEDGGLGVILLYYEHAKKQPVVPRGKSKRKQQDDKQQRDGAAAAAAVAQRAEALATAADAMSKEEMDAEFGEAMANAAMGLLLIAGIVPKEEQHGQEEEAAAAEQEQREDVKQERHK